MWTIRNKILFLIIFPLVFIVGGSFFSANLFLKDRFNSYIENQAVVNSLRIAKEVKDKILVNKEALTEIVFDEKLTGFGIDYLKVFDSDGKLIAHTLTSGQFSEKIDLANFSADYSYAYKVKNGKSFYIINVPLTIGLYKVGLVEISYDFDQIERDLRGVFYSFSAGAIFIVFFVLIFAFMVSKSIATPIKKLSEAANVFSEGDYSVRFNLKTGGEVGDLGKNFNLMADNIEKTQKQLAKEKNLIMSKIEELEKIQKLTMDRELKMIELKAELKKLKNQDVS